MKTDPDSSSWEGLSPWDKAAQWHLVAPHIAEDVMALARERAKMQWKVEEEDAAHRRKMETRLWLTQIFGLVGGLLNVAALTVLAWHYADTGNIVPGLTMFGAGSGLTAGVYAVSRSIGVRARKAEKNSSK
ncbi:hypothetical protein ACIA5C_19860 [Actinoplanes sp. NPDC051343]|uniref:hypothetical protein n=1 Tax=Actinoplanes sp. NPDC051343 TaxID=3363906 RepID=UPI0037B0AF20